MTCMYEVQGPLGLWREGEEGGEVGGPGVRLLRFCCLVAELRLEFWPEGVVGTEMPVQKAWPGSPPHMQ